MHWDIIYSYKISKGCTGDINEHESVTKETTMRCQKKQRNLQSGKSINK
jgi:hypothetical protein